MIHIFDGLKYYNRLVAVGFTEQQAEALVECYKDIWLYMLNRVEETK
jgi:hypothetical protein